MYKPKQGKTFFSSRPHHVHSAFAASVGADSYLFKFDGKTKKPYMELVKAPFLSKPRSEVYICESPLYLLTVLPQKLLDRDITVILLATSPFRMYYERQGATGKRMLLEALRRVDGIVAVSEYVADYYRKLVPSCPVRVAYPYADVRKYDGEYSDLSSRNIAFLGKMMPYKGVDILLEAFSMIRKESPASELYLMGHFKDESLKVPDMDGLTLAGKVDDPREWFKKACVYMHPAREEAFGISIVEACASGLIPIVSDRTGAAEVLAQVSPELIVHTLDPADYARRALKLMDMDMGWKLKVTGALREKAREFEKERRVGMFRDEFTALIEEIRKSRA